MSVLNASDILDMIAKLGMGIAYDYYKGNTKIKITEVTKPEGPIKFVRWTKDQKEAKGAVSVNQIGTLATVFSKKPNYPIHLDRLFSGGGNSRSAFEALLANTPHFFICYPNKTNPYTGDTEHDQKHIMWCPDKHHTQGKIETINYDQVISEVELDADFGSIGVNQGMLGKEFDSIETKKIHTQMQVALVKIGNALDFRTWIAKNDQSILVQNKPLGTLDGVIQSLDEVSILYDQDSKKIGSLIDCIWFTKNFKYMPAVIEVEHSTGVTSGLTRMLKFRETLPSISTSYAVVAPNELRNKVVNEASNAVFKDLNAKYLPYSTLRELYGLIQKYNISKVVNKDFIDPFLEKIVKE